MPQSSRRAKSGKTKPPETSRLKASSLTSESQLPVPRGAAECDEDEIKRLAANLLATESADDSGDGDLEVTIAKKKRKNHRGPKKARATKAEQAAQKAKETAERADKITARFSERFTDPNTLEQEEHFLNRPSIKLPIPDALKALLVGDWENITRNQQLVPLPKEQCVNDILKDYLDVQRSRLVPGSTEQTIVEEIYAGMKLYFDKALGRILLYR